MSYSIGYIISSIAGARGLDKLGKAAKLKIKGNNKLDGLTSVEKNEYKASYRNCLG